MDTSSFLPLVPNVLVLPSSSREGMGPQGPIWPGDPGLLRCPGRVRGGRDPGDARFAGVPLAGSPGLSDCKPAGTRALRALVPATRAGWKTPDAQ